MADKNVNKTSKDSVFCDMFSQPKYLIQLYRALHPEDTESTEADLTEVTLKTILSQGIYNDLGFQVKNKLLILVEAQSTWSPSVIIRSMIYMMQTLQEYFNRHDVNLYRNNHVNFPKPELYVIYNKKRNKQKEYLSLKEEYFPNEDCGIDARVKVIYLDDSDSIINQYIKFCLVLDDQIKIYGKEIKAVEETIRICREKEILSEYLKSREVEVKNIMYTLFDQDRVNELNIKYAVKEMEKDKEAAEKIAKEATEKAEKAAREAAEKEEKNVIEMLKDNFSLDKIAKYTSLTVEQITAIGKKATLL